MEQKVVISELHLERINQFLERDSVKGVYFGIWSFGQIRPSLKFTYREPLNFDLFNNEIQNKKKFPEFDSDYYQRLINDERTKKVIQFIIDDIQSYYKEDKKSLITFPTSLILSLYISEAISLDEYKQELNSLYLDEKPNENIGIFYDKQTSNVFIPNKNIMLIVDGQHRLAGLYAIYKAIDEIKKINNFESILNYDPSSQNIGINRKLIDYAQKNILKLNLPTETIAEIASLIEDFQFSCTILLDYDIWEQGKIFADVNFNQKPVNKSLYYDIFGSFPDPEKNDIYLAHNWTVVLNSTTDSVLYKKIKLLGTGEGYISQAFFVEALLPLLNKNGIWRSDVVKFINTGIINENILKFLKSYFNMIGNIFQKYVPQNGEKTSAYKHVLFKTTGLGALIKLIPYFYPIVEDNLYKNEKETEIFLKGVFDERLQKDKIDSRIDEYIVKLKMNDTSIIDDNPHPEVAMKIKNLESEKSVTALKVSGEYYFSKDSDFSKGGSKGLQDKLFKQLAFDLGFIKTK